MDEDDAYERLRKNIDTYVTGCPPAPEIDEILRILFSEEEALLACGLAFVPRTPDEVAVFDPARCIGCGLCVTGCPESAIELVRREGVPEPAPTGRDVGLKILTEKGKLEDFIKLNAP